MASNYPSSLDNLINPSPTDALNSPTNPHHLQHANANDAIEALQTVLGVLPAGSFLTVKDRIAASEALNGMSDVTITSVATGNVLRYNGSKWVNYPEISLTDGGNY
jgi:hypothetical protein